MADVIPDSHRDILDKVGFAHLATIGPDGEPQSHPVWYDVEGDRLKISTTKDRQKYRNLRRDERVAVSIIDPENPYRYLEIRGRAEVVDDSDNIFIDELAQKYLGQDTYDQDPPDAERVIFYVEPQHIATMG